MRSVVINLQLNDTLITGKADNLYGNKMIYACSSSDRVKYLLHAYTHYLALLAQGEVLEFAFIIKKNSKKNPVETCTIAAEKIKPTEASEILEKYLAYFRQGHEQCFPFFPALGKDEVKLKDMDYGAMVEFLEDKKDDKYSYDFSDSYLVKAIDHGWLSPENFQMMQTLIPAILQPLQTLMMPIFKK